MGTALDDKVDRFVEGLTDSERAELDAADRLGSEIAATGEWAANAHWSLLAAAGGWALSLFIAYDITQTADPAASGKAWPWGLALALAACLQCFAALYGAVTVDAIRRTSPRAALFGIYGLSLAFGWMLAAIAVFKLALSF